jgi:chorismate mutase / prephenate dehydratase
MMRFGWPFWGRPERFSHAAADCAFGEVGRALDYRSVASIDDVFLDVEAGQSDFGVVPVENSTEGAVNTTLDCLIDTSLSIVGEVYIPIEHNMLLQTGADMAEVRRIVSHKQSLGQCRLWLRSHYPDLEQLEVSSNAEAARLAAGDSSTAAIAGLKAAELYGLNVVARGIQDRRNNTTRFLKLARVRNTVPSSADKTSIIVYAENKPGSLFRLLEPFDRYQVSLTRIETRPARDDMWSYVFFYRF